MRKTSARTLYGALALLAPLCLAAGVSASANEPAEHWPTASLAEAGFSEDLGEKIDAGVADGRFTGLHAVLLVRHGKLVLERYYEGEDEVRGRPRGTVDFGPEDLHDLRSITKSIVGLLYGIALAEGSVPGLDTPLLSAFPEYDDLPDDPQRQRMTVAHALSMQLGTEWDESLSYADPRNSEIAMDRAPDRYRYVLDRPMVTEPGTRWIYNGGATAVLARLIEKGTGQPLADYAEKKLFTPLGIATYQWVKGHDGAYIAASGLRLRPRGLARIGQLVLNGGRWEGQQVVPEDWLVSSFETRADVDRDVDYGYHWWLGKNNNDRKRWVGAFGNGGQRLQIMPRGNMLMVVTAGNYNQPDAWKVPVGVLLDAVLPSIER